MGWIVGLTLGILIALGVRSTVTQKRIEQMGEVKRIIGLDLPGNGRQVPEGYTVSGMISNQSVPIIKRRGIRVVLSAVSPPAEVVALLRDNNIEWIPVRIGSTFRHASTFDDVANRYRPNQILIHCAHGADRSGVILAYMLATRHDWPFPDALYAVVAPTVTDTRGLAHVLSGYDINDARSSGGHGVGTYSPMAVGHSGGLKARNAAYHQLISTTIDQILAKIVTLRV